MAKSEFSERFPALHHEIFEEKQPQTLKIDEVQSTAEIAEKDDQIDNKVESGDRLKISDQSIPIDTIYPPVFIPLLYLKDLLSVLLFPDPMKLQKMP